MPPAASWQIRTWAAITREYSEPESATSSMAPGDGITALARRALGESERGNFGGLDEALAALADAPDPTARAWRACLAAVRWSVAPGAAPPTREEVAAFASGPDEARQAGAE